jgi:hypothetical protein
MRNRRRNLRSVRDRVRLTYEACEKRQLLASFTATDGTDEVIISFDNGRPATIQINGVLSINPDATLNIDLGKSLGERRPDRLVLEGGTFGVTGTATVTDGPGTDGDIVNGLGEVNNVAYFTFQTSVNVVTGGGNDQFNLTAPHADADSSVYPGQWQRYFNVSSGAGNDILRFAGYVGNIDLGDGADTVLADPGPPVGFDQSDKLRGYFNGGKGYDEFRLSYRLGLLYVSSELTFGLRNPDSNNLEPVTGYVESVESLVNQPGSSASVVSAKYSTYDSDLLPALRIDIQGNRARITNASTPGLVDVFGFNEFDGAQLATAQGTQVLWNPTAVIWSTAYDLRISQFETINVGGNTASGLAHEITHRLSLYANRVLVSSSASSTGRDVYLSHIQEADGIRYVLSGLTGRSIEFRNYDQFLPPAGQRTFFPAHLVVYGSNTANDRFFVSGTGAARDRTSLVVKPSRVSMYGLGGDDGYWLGSTIGGATRNLDHFNGQVDVIGGAGNDRLRLDDRDSGCAWGYRFKDPWFSVADKVGCSSRNAFIGVWHSGLEELSLIGNSQDNRFWITPSLTTRYVINGGGNSTSAGDRLILIAPYPEHRIQIIRGFGAGTWYFGINGSDDSTHKAIIYSDIAFAPAP